MCVCVCVCQCMCVCARCRLVNFAVPSNHKLKFKDSEKRDNYFGLNRELRRLRNMRVTVIRIVADTLGTVPKGLKRGLEELEI